MPATKKEVSREEFKKLQETVSEMKKELATTKKQITGKKEKTTRKATPYNLFIGKKIREISAKYPDKPHKLAFSEAVEAWKVKKAIEADS